MVNCSSSSHKDFFQITLTNELMSALYMLHQIYLIKSANKGITLHCTVYLFYLVDFFSTATNKKYQPCTANVGLYIGLEIIFKSPFSLWARYWMTFILDKRLIIYPIGRDGYSSSILSAPLS